MSFYACGRLTRTIGIFKWAANNANYYDVSVALTFPLECFSTVVIYQKIHTYIYSIHIWRAQVSFTRSMKIEFSILPLKLQLRSTQRSGRSTYQRRAFWTEPRQPRSQPKGKRMWIEEEREKKVQLPLHWRKGRNCPSHIHLCLTARRQSERFIVGLIWFTVHCTAGE